MSAQKFIANTIISEEQSSDNSDKLTIISPGKKMDVKKRKRKKLPSTTTTTTSEDDEESQIDKAIEQKLQECAKKNNITQIEMKKILRKIVGNDHVLALVKIQEETELALEEHTKNSKELLQENAEKNQMDLIPKLTRSKYRQLHNDTISIPLFNETNTEPEVIALISDDLHTDEEDDEYEPKEEDFISEDDFNTTASDLDSQPRTPMTPISYIDIDSPVSLIKSAATLRFTSDGLFKIPRERNDSIVSQHEEIIAKRTRSKLCLEDTAIETIESTFIPPDITSDMYDFDVEMDHAWMEFLNEFTKPLNSSTGHEEDDPEADPEYVAADKIPLDAEELRDVNISKKELSDLVNELFDGLVKDGVITEDLPSELDTPKKHTNKNVDKSISGQSPQKKKLKFISSNQQQNFDQQPNEDTLDFVENLNHTNSNMNNTTFQPNIMSTPHIPQLISLTNRIAQPVDNCEKVYNYSNIQPQEQEQNYQTSKKISQKNSTIVGNNLISQATVLNTPTNSNHPTQNLNTTNIRNSTDRTVLAFPVPGSQKRCYQIAQISPTTKITPNSYFSLAQVGNISNQQIFVRIANQIPSTYVDLTQSPTKSQPSNEQTSKSKNKKIVHPDYFEMWKGDAHTSAVKYYNTFYEQKYKDLQNEDEIVETYNQNEIGFTSWQRQMFDQQMRIHIQFITQNYLQIYSHPQFWKMAKNEKDMILELDTKRNGKEDSAFNAINLNDALQLIENWEKELSEDTLENKAFMDFIYHEINRNNTAPSHSTNRIIKFPPRTMKRILNSKIFMYPEYLPRLPFRTKYSNASHDFSPIESHLLAFGLEKYLPEVEKEIQSRPDIYRKYSIIKLTCIQISDKLMLGKTPQRIYEYYKNQLKDVHYNPIKYFNERKKAPKFQHIFIPINLENILPPIKRLPELHMVWKEFGTSLKLLEYKKPLSKTKKKLTTQLDEVKLSNERSEKLKQKKVNQKDDNSLQNVVINLNYILDNSGSNNANYNQNLNEELTTNNVTLLNNDNNNSAVTSDQCSVQYNIPKQERRVSLTDYTQICTRIHDTLNLNQDIDNCLLDYPDNLEDNHQVTSSLSNQSKERNIINNTSSISIYNNNNNVGTVIEKGQKLLTDFYPIEQSYPNLINTSIYNSDNNSEWSDIYKLKNSIKRKKINLKKKKNYNYILQKQIWIRKEFRKVAKNVRKSKRIQNKLHNLLVQYWTYLFKLYNKYKNLYLRKVFINFKALEIYTNLLNILKMHCKKSNKTSASDELLITNNFNCKKTKIIDDEAAKLKKQNRLSESLRQMLLPENKEESNKKDAIYAYNYYEKVEETLINCGEQQKFKKFQNILKLFDPLKDKISDLYYQIENLFLPNHSELAQVFLTFLLPSEAIQIGKFFEHFMITNMGTFINKLNIYFNKQPAQIRKIYSSLNDMADDPDLNMDKIKSKILPLLKGNQFLIDWFLQIFPDETPPESLLTVTENVCLKEVDSQQDGVVYESVPPKDIIEDTTEIQPCQLRYINGRLFYGSRILLPAKLAFMAQNLSKDDEKLDENNFVGEDNHNIKNNNGCVHGIRELAEKRLKLNSLDNHSSCDENDKSEDEDGKAELKSFELCDESTFRMHAIRLNPSLYATDDYSVNFYKSKGFDDNSGKSSPKKQFCKNNMGSNTAIQNSSLKDNKRKSPKKNLPKSPCNSGTKRGPPSSTDSLSLNALMTAKKLKSITNDDDITNSIDQNKIKKKTNKNTKLNTNIISPINTLPHTVISANLCSTETAISTNKKLDETVIMKQQQNNIDENINNEKCIEIKSPAWTREEDKIILEETKINQLATEETLLKRLSKKLKDRTENEILIRHQFLMDLLCRLQKRN